MSEKIIGHCLIKNEENFIWYAINSVLPFVDKIMVWDTGSKDKTVEIIKTIKSPKIEFKEVGSIDADGHPEMRNLMLKATDKNKYHWLMILDGDEIWPSKAIKKTIKYLQSHPQTQAVFVRTINAVGDIYHRRPESAGHYQIKEEEGHLGLRFINFKTVPKLYVNLPHGQEGFFSTNKVSVQNLPKVAFVNVSYLHTTRLKRSSLDKITLKRRGKRKYELGDKVYKNQLPEIIFKEHPAIVPDVSHPMNLLTFLLCAFLTIPRRLNRRLFTPKKTGY